MDEVYSKTEVGPLNGTPDKRLFWSIISDYDLKTGLCELVDNALDMWRSTGKKRPLKIEISLDLIRQLISVKDNAGGVKQSELHLLLSPGGSRNDPGAEIIGIFGVGSKRAGVALGEEVRIRTRFRNEQTYEIDIPKEWLESPSWEMAYYRVPSIANGTTIVEFSHLRKPFDDSDVQSIKEHLSEAYGWFLENGCQILLGPTEIKARSFKSWSYPSKFLPREVAFNADFKSDGKLSVLVTGRANRGS